MEIITILEIFGDEVAKGVQKDNENKLGGNLIKNRDKTQLSPSFSGFILCYSLFFFIEDSEQDPLSSLPVEDANTFQMHASICEREGEVKLLELFLDLPLDCLNLLVTVLLQP